LLGVVSNLMQFFKRDCLGDRCLEIYPSDELSFPAERCIGSPPERSTVMERGFPRRESPSQSKGR
jgi:hypothetical protein